MMAAKCLANLDIFTAHHRHLNVVGAFQTIADEDGAADGQRREAVLPGALQMLQGILRLPGYMVLQSVKSGRPIP